MAKRVFLHIGTMKSATTFLQNLFELNAEKMAAQGLVWNGTNDSFGTFHDLLQPGTRRWANGRWPRAQERIRKLDGDVLISNELLASLQPADVARIVEGLAPAELHVIITARDLGRVIPSHWQTLTRNRGRITWKDFLAATRSRFGKLPIGAGKEFWLRHDIADIVHRWSTQIPLSRITVVTVPPPGSPYDEIAKRFATVVGIKVDDFSQPPPSNPSLGAHSSELLRRLNTKTRHLDLQHHQIAFKRSLARKLALRSKSEPSLGLSPQELKPVQKRAKKLVRAVRSSGVTVVGDLEDLIPPSSLARPDAYDPGQSSPTDLLVVAKESIEYLTDAIALLTGLYDAIGSELRAAGSAEQFGVVSWGPTAVPLDGDSPEAPDASLDAHIDLIVELCTALADRKIEYDRLVQAVIEKDPIDYQSDEWKSFSIPPHAPGMAVPGGTKLGFFVQHRLAQRPAH